MAEKYDIDIKSSKLSQHEETLNTVSNHLTEMLLDYNLEDDNKDITDYLKSRKIDENTIRYFKLGVFPHKERIKDNYFNYFGSFSELNNELLLDHDYEGNIFTKFDRHIVFPISNENGIIKAFAARQPSENTSQKYLKSRNSGNYKFSQFLYNYSNINKEKDLIITEGPFDVWALHQNGETNSVAVMGNSISEEQHKLIRNHRNTIYLAFDGGDKNKKNILEVFNKYPDLIKKTKVIVLMDKEDPYDYVITRNKKNIKSLGVESSEYIIKHLLTTEKRTTEFEVEILLIKIFNVLKEVRLISKKLLFEVAKELFIDYDTLNIKFSNFIKNKSKVTSLFVRKDKSHYYIEINGDFYFAKYFENVGIFSLILEPFDVVDFDEKELDFTSGNNVMYFTDVTVEELIKYLEGEKAIELGEKLFFPKKRNRKIINVIISFNSKIDFTAKSSVSNEVELSFKKIEDMHYVIERNKDNRSITPTIAERYLNEYFYWTYKGIKEMSKELLLKYGIELVFSFEIVNEKHNYVESIYKYLK